MSTVISSPNSTFTPFIDNIDCLGQIMCKFSADRLFISADVFNEYTLQKAAYVAAQTVFYINLGLRWPLVNCSKIVRKLLVRYLALFDNVQGNRSLLACDLVNSKKITLL